MTAGAQNYRTNIVKGSVVNDNITVIQSVPTNAYGWKFIVLSITIGVVTLYTILYLVFIIKM